MLTRNPRITAAGLALFTKQAPGFSVALTHVAVGTAVYDPTGNETALKSEFARFPIATGVDISASQLQVGALVKDTDPQGRSANNKWIGEIGFYVGTTLLAVMSQSARALFYKSPELDVALSYILDFSTLPPGSLTVGAPKLSEDIRLAAQTALASAQSATGAAATIRATYYGNSAVAPTLRPDGTARQKGDRYFDTVANAERTWNGALWGIANPDAASLAKPSGASIVGYKTGSVATALEEVDGKINGTTQQINDLRNRMYRRSVVHKIPMRFPGYATVIAAKGYTYLFPQSFTMHATELYILYGANTGAAGTGSFVAIHNRATGAYISGFSIGESYGEGIVVKMEGTKKYLYARHKSSVLGKYNITNRPANLSTLAPESTTDLGFYSFLSWDGSQFTMQVLTRSSRASQPRNLFVRLDESLALQSRLEFNRLDAWNLSAEQRDLAPKLQGFSHYRGGYVLGYGATHYYGGAKKQSDLCGIKLFTSAGDPTESALMNPDAFIDILRAKGYSCDLIENEGMHYADDGELYGMWVTSSHTNTGNYGILITREMGGDIDCTAAATAATPGASLEHMLAKVDHDDKGIKNPMTGAPFTTLVEIVEFMRETQLSQYGFTTTGSTIKDLAGNNLPGGHIFMLMTGNYFSWEVLDYSSSGIATSWISGEKGALVQAYPAFTLGGQASETMNSVSVGVGSAAKIAIGRNTTDLVSLFEAWGADGVIGRISTIGANTRFYIGKGAFITGGTGSPEGVVSAPRGSMYLREDGTGQCRYEKESGNGNTGWVQR